MVGAFGFAATILAASGILLTLASSIIAMMMELIWPASRIPPKERILGIWFIVVGRVLAYSLSPAVVAFSSLMLFHLGAGMLALPDDGWRLGLSVAIYFVTFDFLRYWIHRVEHAVPILWAMHSFHHNDAFVNVFTGDRVYWLSQVVQMILLSLSLGLLFSVPPLVIANFMVLEILVRATNHLNVHIHLGRVGRYIVGPQYHRIHHSVEPKHWNKNFAQALPIFDIVFGTAWHPMATEWPETGLPEISKKADMIDAISWPLVWARHRHPSDNLAR